MTVLRLSNSSLSWALNQAERFGDTNRVFPQPFEFAAIRHDWGRLAVLLRSKDVLKWSVRPIRECLSPKGSRSFRIVTQLDPLDWIIYSALVYELGADLESYRLPQEEGVVFSWRFAPLADGTMFSRETGYAQFVERSRQLASMSNDQYVVVTDIADFFPNLNHHRVENALRSAAPTKANHTTAIMRLLGGWREKQSFGIPVGPNASRLVAEVAIHDIDQALRGAGLTFVRYADDFRIFCKTRKDAYIAVATLAEVLWKSHGLTLAGQKTEILPVERFNQQFFQTGREAELERLAQSFADIVDALELDSWYDEIDYSDLDEEQKASVDALNLGNLLTEQLEREYIDIQLTKFILRRLGQLQNADVADEILSYIDKLYPAFADVITYLDNLEHLTEGRRLEISNGVLSIMDDSVVSHLEYHRMHLLNLFVSNAAWGNSQRLAEMWPHATDHFTKRKLILALGTSGQNYWFRQRKTEWQHFSHWERRAFLHGASSLEADERKHWFDSIRRRLDPLEEAVVNWSMKNPIDT